SLGTGSFAAPVSAFCLSNSKPTAIVLGDLERNGKLDAVCIESVTNTFQVFRNSGTTLASATAGDRYSTGTGPVDLALADVNGDGKLDVIVLCQGARQIEVHLGNGDGTFGGAITTGLLAADGNVSAIALGDIDRDGVLDCVVASANQTVIEVLKGS